MTINKIIYPELTAQDLDNLGEALKEKLQKKYSDKNQNVKEKVDRYSLISVLFIFPETVCIVAGVATLLWTLFAGFSNRSFTLPLVLCLLTIVISIAVWLLSRHYIKLSDRADKELERFHGVIYSEVSACGFRNYRIDVERVFADSKYLIGEHHTFYPELEKLNELKKGVFDRYEISVTEGTTVVVSGIVNGFSVWSTGFSPTLEDFKKLTAQVESGILDFTYLDDRLAGIRKDIDNYGRE